METILVLVEKTTGFLMMNSAFLAGSTCNSKEYLMLEIGLSSF